MLQPKPLQDLCCQIQSTLFAFCLSEADLCQLGVWSDERSQKGFSPDVWCRALLHRKVQGDEAMAIRVSDLLDVAYFDTVIYLRGLDVEDLTS